MYYEYVAYTRNGAMVRGTTQANNVNEVRETLWSHDYFVAQIKETRPPIHWREQFPSLFGVKVQEVVIFTRQVALLLRSGIPLVRALSVLREQVTNVTFKETLDKVQLDVEAGVPLSDALLKYPSVFNDLYCRLVQVGERAGRLDATLEQLATFIEKQDAVMKRIKGAFTYPAFIIAMAAGAVFMLVNFALPGIIGMFKDSGGALPAPTRILLAITNHAGVGSAVIGALLAIILGGGYASYQTPDGRRRIDGFFLKVPMVKDIILKGALASTTRSVAMLIRAGISLPDVMELTSGTISNSVIRASFLRLQQGLLQGRGLAEPLEQDPLFPRLAVQMVRVGEETGSLDTMLDTVAEFYEKDVDRAITSLTSKIEPTLITVMGMMVAFIAIAVISPMYGMLGNVK